MLDLGMLRKDRGCPVLLGCKTAGTGRPRNSHLQQNGNGFRGLEWMNMAWGGGLRMGGSETASTGECGHQSPVLPSPWGVTRRNEPKTMVAVTGGGGEIPANTCWLVEWTFQLGLTRVRQKRWGGGQVYSAECILRGQRWWTGSGMEARTSAFRCQCGG